MKRHRRGHPDPGGRHRQPSASLRHDRSFRLFWTARTLSLAGTAVNQVVLPILVFQLTGSASQTALLLTIEAAPYVVFGLFAATMADRVNRRALMISCDLVNAVVIASIPLAAALGVLTVARVYVAALVANTVWVWFDAAEFGAVPAIVGRQRIVSAASVLASTWELIRIAVPAVGGALAAVLGPAPVLWIDAASYLGSAALLARIPHRFAAPGAEAGDRGPKARRHVVRNIVEGLRFVRRHALIWPLTTAGFGASLSSGAIIGLLVVYGVRQLGLADNDARLGWLFSALAAGGLAAALALPRLSRKVSPPRLSLLGLAAGVPLIGAVALATTLPVALAVLLAWQGMNSLVIINGIALRQRLIPDRLQCRVNVTARIIAWGGQPFGAAIGGLIADHASVRVTYLTMSLGVATGAILAWLSPLRRADMAMVERLQAELDAPQPEVMVRDP